MGVQVGGDPDGATDAQGHVLDGPGPPRVLEGVGAWGLGWQPRTPAGAGGRIDGTGSSLPGFSEAAIYPSLSS